MTTLTLMCVHPGGNETAAALEAPSARHAIVVAIVADRRRDMKASSQRWVRLASAECNANVKRHPRRCPAASRSRLLLVDDQLEHLEHRQVHRDQDDAD